MEGIGSGKEERKERKGHAWRIVSWPSRAVHVLFIFPLGNGKQYFQVDTIISPILGTPQGSSTAYFFNSVPVSGGTAGINFSVYDANQDGNPDTVFHLDFGPSIAAFSDDIIVAYAFDSSLSGIDVYAARAALIVPEPSTTLLLRLGAMGLIATRHRKV